MGNTSEMLPVIGPSVIERMEKGISTEGVVPITREGVRSFALTLLMNKLAGLVHPLLTEPVDFEPVFINNTVAFTLQGLTKSADYLGAVSRVVRGKEMVEWMFTQTDLVEIAVAFALKRRKRTDDPLGDLSGIAQIL